jgi:cystathionine beta-lyase family protein involved in aluminum resistance
VGRKAIDINIRLDRQEKKILRLTEEIEEAKEEYQKLIEEKKEEDKKKLFEAYRKSKRSLEEVLDFMKGKADI